MQSISTDILAITKNKNALSGFETAIAGRFLTEILLPEDALEIETIKTKLFVLALNMLDPDDIALVKRVKNRVGDNIPSIFIINMGNRLERVEAETLGARHLVDTNESMEDLSAASIRVLMTSNGQVKGSKGEAEEAFGLMSETMDQLGNSIKKGDQLSTEAVHMCTDSVIECVGRHGVNDLLGAIRQHHSFTYRHSMIVTIFASSMAQHYNMRNEDVERVTVGALLHDVGKYVVSPKILDKPSRLSESEESIMRRHPVDGAMLLRNSGNFTDEIIEIARHHHEMLDGSGYPDGLSGRGVSDIVRLMTVVDIFSALIEARTYKESLPAEEAYDVLVSMGNKIDQEILRAFRPIALSSDEDDLICKLKNPTAA